MRARHPGRTKTERRILDEVCCGEATPRATRTALDKMVADGLLIFLGNEPIGRDALGVISLPRYDVPTAVHFQWCEYQSSLSDSEARP